MADIRVERRRKPIWPWIVGLILIVGAVWLLVDMTGKDRRETGVAFDEEWQQQEQTMTQEDQMQGEEQMQGQQQGQGIPEASAYVNFIDENNVKEAMGVNHEMTAEALSRLGDAINGLAAGQADVSGEVNLIKERAQQIQQDPQSLQHANRIQEAFTSASDALQKVQQQRFPDMGQDDLNSLNESASAINPQEQLLNQKDQIESFFEESANVVEQMNSEIQG
ncbi:MAG: hypothetical protein ACK40G_11910 [Cytophagaceae bacterium]